MRGTEQQNDRPGIIQRHIGIHEHRRTLLVGRRGVATSRRAASNPTRNKMMRCINGFGCRTPILSEGRLKPPMPLIPGMG